MTEKSGCAAVFLCLVKQIHKAALYVFHMSVSEEDISRLGAYDLKIITGISSVAVAPYGYDGNGKFPLYYRCVGYVVSGMGDKID